MTETTVTETTAKPPFRVLMIVRMVLFVPLWLLLSVAVALSIIAALPGRMDEASAIKVQAIFGATTLVLLVLVWLLIRHRRGQFLTGLAVLLLLVAGAWGGLYVTGVKAYEQEVAKWHAIGGTTEYAELLPAPVPPPQNAAESYVRAFAAFPPDAMADAKTGALLAEPWKADAEQLQAVVARHGDALTLLRRAMVQPECVWPSAEDEAPGQRFAYCARAAQLLVAEAIVNATDDDLTASTASILAGLRLAHGLTTQRDAPSHGLRTYVEQLMLDAYEHLFRDRPLRAEMIEAALPRLGHRPLVRQVLMAEPPKAFLQRRAEGSGPLTPLGMLYAFVFPQKDTAFLPGLAPWGFVPGNLHRDMAAYLALYRSIVDFCGQPRHKQDPNQAPQLDSLPQYAVFARVFTALPNIGTYNQAIALHEARIQLAVIAGRLRAYKIENGQYPDALQALGQVPVDVWNGQPIGYKRVEDGFELTGSASPTPDGNTVWRWSK